jgi:hypothetical protein
MPGGAALYRSIVLRCDDQFMGGHVPRPICVGQTNSVTDDQATMARIPCELRGAWAVRWNRPIWIAEVTCAEPFVAVLFSTLGAMTGWSKSLPTASGTMTVSVETLENDQSDLATFHAKLGAGAYTTVAVPKMSHPPLRLSHESQFFTGELTAIATPTSPRWPKLSLLCFAKRNVVVRRNHVWGVKPSYLNQVPSHLAQLLARGRHGSIAMAV